MRLVRRFTGTGTITFYGFRQNDRRLAFVMYRRMIRREQFVGIVTATIKLVDLFIGQVRDQLFQFRVFAKEMLTGKRATVILERLVFAVDGFFHAFAQHTQRVTGQQRIPLAAPDHLDDIPAGTAEHTFEFLNDLAVAAHRSIQSLQVAVHHENQVVELFPSGQGNTAQGFRLIHLAITQERPHLAIFPLDQLAVLQVFHEMGLVNGLDRPQSHGHGRELPEIRHQPGMRIGGQALAFHFTAEILQLILTQAPFQKRAGVNTRCGMSLIENQITTKRLIGGTKEMVEAHIVHGGR